MGGKKGGLGGIVNTGKNLLFGKKDPGTSDRYLPLEAEQQEALSKYSDLLKTNTDNVAKSTVMAQENAIRANAGDAQRAAQGLVAQRGLGRSSVGLNAIINSTRNMGDQIGQARGQLPALQYNMRVSNLNSATGGIQNILGSRTFIQGQKSTGRGGGLLGLGMGAAGAYMAAKSGGDPGAGFAAGQGAGRGIANL